MLREQTLAGQSPDSTYGEAQHPTFKKERRVSEQAIILFICQDRFYQLTGFYFQVGVVLIVVAQTTFMMSSQFWGPVALTLLASIATIVSVWIKLKSYSEHRTALEEETADSKVRRQFLSPHALFYRICGKKGEEKKNSNMT